MKRNILDARDSHIWSLRMFAVLITIVATSAIYGLITAADEVKVRIPPDYAKGVLLEPNAFPKSALYANAYMIFQSLQFWQHNGQDDYKTNIEAYGCYVNAPMLQWLNNDYQQKNADHELFRRTRNIAVAGTYSDDLVQEVGNGVWRVWLDIRIRDYLDNELFKETMVRYPLQIAVDHRPCNPVNLAIDAMFDTPRRISGQTAAKDT